MTTCTKRQWMCFSILAVIILIGGGATALWYTWTDDCGYVDSNCACQDTICQVCTLSTQLNATDVGKCDRCHHCERAENGCNRWVNTPLLIGGIIASIFGLMMLILLCCGHCNVPRRFMERQPNYGAQPDYGALDD